MHLADLQMSRFSLSLDLIIFSHALLVDAFNDKIKAIRFELSLLSFKYMDS